MLKRYLVVFLITAFATLNAQGPSKILLPVLTPQYSGTTNGLIAVSPVNPLVVWASGRNGTFTVTTDGGNTWTAGVVPGAELLQFRDVQGVSAKVAYLQSIGNNTPDFRIYKTVDGGATWTMQFQNQLAGAFYDCFAFWGPKRGISHSDSVNGVFPGPPNHRRNELAKHQQQYAACLARGSVVRRERYMRSHARWPERVDCDGRIDDCPGAGDERRRRYLERIRHSAGKLAERRRIHRGVPQPVGRHRGRRRPGPGRSE